MLEKKKLLLGAVAGVAIATAYTAPVDAKVTLMADEPSGWSFSVDGNVNAFYVYSTGKNANMASGQTARTSTGENTRIQTGLLPSKFGFGVQGPASNGVQLRGYFALYPQIQNNNTKTARGAQVDMREIYSAASGDFGEVLFGRTLSLFQRNAIVQDMTLFGVGATADNTNNGGTTLGRIGFGYVYHKIFIETLMGEIPQLNEDLQKGYDRLSGGFSMKQSITFMFLSNNEKINFHAGLEIIECWSKDLRTQNYSTGLIENEKRFDVFIGLKIGWILPLRKRTTSNFYYY